MSVEYLNRQLVWEGFAEFILFLSPIVGDSLSNLWVGQMRIGRRLLLRSHSDYNDTGTGRSSDGDEAVYDGNEGDAQGGSDGLDVEERQSRRRAHLRSSVNARNSSRCYICQASPPVMPHFALPCRHLFCYTCIATAVEEDPYFKCGQCKTPVHKIERYGV